MKYTIIARVEQVPGAPGVVRARAVRGPQWTRSWTARGDSVEAACLRLSQRLHDHYARHTFRVIPNTLEAEPAPVAPSEVAEAEVAEAAQQDREALRQKVDDEMREVARQEARGLVQRLGWPDLLATLAEHAGPDNGADPQLAVALGILSDYLTPNKEG